MLLLPGGAAADYRSVSGKNGLSMPNRGDRDRPRRAGKIYRQAQTAKQRKELGPIVTLTLFSMLFWAFAQQGGSPISLYIDRFVNRDISGYSRSYRHVPVGERLAVMLCGSSRPLVKE